MNAYDPHPDEYKGTASQELKEFLSAMKGKGLGVSVLFDESVGIWQDNEESLEPVKFNLPSKSELVD